MKQFIYTDKAPKAIGIYAQATKAGNTLYVSGQIPLDPNTQEIVAGNFSKQTEQVLLNLQAIIETAGATLDDILKLNIYLTDLTNFAEVNSVMATFFTEPYPARACVEVKALPKGVPVEMDAVVHLSE